MATQKTKTSPSRESDPVDVAELAKEVQTLELLARRSEAKLRRIEADIRLREVVAKNRAEVSAKSEAFQHSE